MKLFKVRDFLLNGTRKEFKGEIHVLAESEEQIKNYCKDIESKNNISLASYRLSWKTEYENCDELKIVKLDSDGFVFFNLNLKQVIDNATF